MSKNPKDFKACLKDLDNYPEPVAIQFASVWQEKNRDLLTGNIGERLSAASPKTQGAIANYVKQLRESQAARAKLGLPEYSHGSKHSHPHKH